jgi:hypothetical protein
VLVQVHTETDADSARGFIVNWGVPDFTKVNGDLYWAAWRTLRAAATVTLEGKDYA